MSKRMFGVMVLVVCLLALPLAAMADLVLNYEYVGTFKVNSGYYGQGLAYVPDGVGNSDRPTPVTGPTILTTGWHGAQDYLKEWYIPTPVTSGVAPSASQVTTAAGGTYVDDLNTLLPTNPSPGMEWRSLTVMGGTAWGLRLQLGHEGNLDNFGRGLIKMGTNEDWGTMGNTGITRPQSFGGTGAFVGDGVANKWDETDTLVLQEYTAVTGGYQIYVNKAVKGAGGVGGDPHVYNWTVTPVFNFFIAPSVYQARYMDLEYVEIGGTKYYVLNSLDGQAATELMFFDASTASGVVAAPDFTIDVTSDITNGVGWWSGNSQVKDLAYDGDATLYLFDTGGSGGAPAGYVHVFSFSDAGAPPIPEPAGLGLLGLALLGLRRRRS